MPKKLLRRFMPDPQKLKESKSLRFLGHRIHDPKLWHINRHSIRRAVTIGFFITFLPIVGHMVFAAISAFFLGANLPVAVIAVWLVNPLIMPATFYLAYRIGIYILGIPIHPFEFEFSFEFLSKGLLDIAVPMLLGSVILGISAAIIGNLLVRVLWRCFVVRQWRHRHKEREKERQHNE